MKRKDLYSKLYSKYGTSFQHVKAVEELTELSLAVQRVNNNTLITTKMMDNLVEEIVDAQIMIEQLIHHYGLSTRVFNKKRAKKRSIEKMHIKEE